MQRISIFWGIVWKLGQKTRKRVNFGSFFLKFQMWIVLFWLNLYDWSFQGCYKIKFWAIKICKIWPLGDSATFVWFFVKSNKKGSKRVNAETAFWGFGYCLRKHICNQNWWGTFQALIWHQLQWFGIYLMCPIVQKWAKKAKTAFRDFSLALFWTAGHLRLIPNHYTWCKIKAWNVPNQFWLQEYFLKPKTKHLEAWKCSFGIIGPFLALFWTKGHPRLIPNHCKWCQIKAWNVPHQFSFQKYFLKQ